MWTITNELESNNNNNNNNNNNRAQLNPTQPTHPSSVQLNSVHIVKSRALLRSLVSSLLFHTQYLTRNYFGKDVHDSMTTDRLTNHEERQRDNAVKSSFRLHSLRKNNKRNHNLTTAKITTQSFTTPHSRSHIPTFTLMELFKYASTPRTHALIHTSHSIICSHRPSHAHTDCHSREENPQMHFKWIRVITCYRRVIMRKRVIFERVFYGADSDRTQCVQIHMCNYTCIACETCKNVV